VRSLADYPTEKLRRPLTQPAATGSATIEGTLVSAFAGGGAAALGSLSLGYAVASACGVELAVNAQHGLTPAAPFERVSAALTFGLSRSVALTLANQARLPGTREISAVNQWVGVPFRVALNDWFGLVGLDRLAGVEFLWQGRSGARLDVTLALPAGVLFQPLSRLSVQLLGRPSFRVVPQPTASLDAEVELLFVPLRWLDLRLHTLMSPRATSVRIDTTVGATARF
jgi:hypothetical protein